MGTGMAVAIVMACLAILVVAKMRGPVDDEAALIMLTRSEAAGANTRAGAGAFFVILLFIIFLAAILIG
ncbi:MAG: hypothetical protein M1546_15870 [Chloroflexi bacterium]|nr:hypothetical protein [Chloroflexota bacterium]